MSRYISSAMHGACSSAGALSGFGAATNASEQERFQQQATLADEALQELQSYVFRIRARALQEKSGLLGDEDVALRLNALADQIEKFSTKSGPLMLSKAVAEGSFERLRELQRVTKNVTANAKSEALTFADLFVPRKVQEFVSIVIVGSVVDLGEKTKKLLDSTLKTADTLSDPWAIKAGIAIAALFAVGYAVRAFK